MRTDYMVKRESLNEACKVAKPISWKVISTLEHQLDNVLSTQERYWKQMAHIDWLRNGDRNSPFFHLKASARKACNNIAGLRNDVSNWIESKQGMEAVITHYFEQIFASSNPTQEDIREITYGVQAKLDSQNVSFLDKIFVAETKQPARQRKQGITKPEEKQNERPTTPQQQP
ncbi:hypothetical protein LWI28_002285 [Acer negundo]|uniref:Uncharacterized protein n=1 Tax=Acer negundo TaxID=4023 RepID=A0AAD5JL30_ACENE|nr:hypothetical protein LWI28_002285 [Acer negundo]